MNPNQTRPIARQDKSASWAKSVLIAAAVYNLAWGTWVVLRPDDFFNWAELEIPTYPFIWQCVGMIVGVYGVGYAIASRDPVRHWPIVFVGFLGKVFGPIGIAWNLATGSLSMDWVLLTIFNDLIWLFPFAAILFMAFDIANRPEAGPTNGTMQELNVHYQSQHGETIGSLSAKRPVLVVFLRHAGCTFCREALGDISEQREQIEKSGVTIVLVHMGDNQSNGQLFASYGLADVHRISDPDCHLYQAYGLQRGGINQLVPPSVWWRGFQAAILNRHGFGKLVGDGFQMPGVFLVEDNQVVHSYLHETSGSRPSYCNLAASDEVASDQLASCESVTC
ncbi:AhpC/TSA family protein [Stieleria sp. JC731]|uniref:peroxiredoxin-like family protein n=1 Tax=Pirellulaceae TaxID=2691357 RepID=UPI001E57687B|nr:peroxiredoxin-like family protein [Stieleria sp. JC731]MCC9601327.1 AhpC/TSA family protein [Stieleria sp. JC731]